MIYDLELPRGAVLAACPFCGASASLFCDGEGVYAGCDSKQCLVTPITLTFATKRDACRAWNKRGAETALNPIVPVGGKFQVVATSRSHGDSSCN